MLKLVSTLVSGINKIVGGEAVGSLLEFALAFSERIAR
jgi:hypothetical protein